MSEQSEREAYNEERREAERYCKHGRELCDDCALEQAVTLERSRCAELVNWFRDRQKTWGGKSEPFDQLRDAVVYGAVVDGIRLAYPELKQVACLCGTEHPETVKPNNKNDHAGNCGCDACF